jgi:thioredoxin reductase (NADPH)
LQAEAHGFTADTTIGSVKALRVLIATGITDKCPELDVMDSADVKQAVRYCPICDGFEAIKKKIAVYGPLDGAGGKAQFLRIYSPFVTLLPTTLNDKGNQPTSTEFAVASSPPEKILARDNRVDVVLENATRLDFDVLYPAIGCRVHSDLATALGAKSDEAGCLAVDGKQRTVDGIYAAGDVVSDLHQLVVAEGHAAVAATAMHNSLPANLAVCP